jgi:DNA invertase Pin-like site-specific DNA recombinase
VKRVAAYVRVSTASKSRQGDALSFDQNPEVQEQPLREMVAARGRTLPRVHSDRAFGPRERRPRLDVLMGQTWRGQSDGVVVWRFDRFARSVEQLVIAMEEFWGLGIDSVSHQGALDTSTPMGKAMFTVIAAMAELERDVIRERVVVGLHHARWHRMKSEKRVGRSRAVFRRDEVSDLRRQGLSWLQIASRLGVSTGSVRRAVQALNDPSAPCQVARKGPVRR